MNPPDIMCRMNDNGARVDTRGFAAVQVKNAVVWPRAFIVEIVKSS